MTETEAAHHSSQAWSQRYCAAWFFVKDVQFTSDSAAAVQPRPGTDALLSISCILFVGLGPVCLHGDQKKL